MGLLFTGIIASEIEGPQVVAIAIRGGCLGVIVCAKAMYEIVEHSERKAAKNRLLARRKNETQPAVTEVK